MTGGFHALLDAPATVAARVQIAKLGDFKDGRYGEFSITRSDVENWQANLTRLPGERALIDLDHRADRQPRNTEAAGWITGVDFDGDTPVANVEWTPVGKQAIRDKRYLFFSPTYGEFKDETGKVHENTLIGAALTNRPFLNMPALTLASEETLTKALEEEQRDRLAAAVERAASAKTGTSDSRRAMEKQILTVLGLEDDADDAKILEAVTALHTKANDEPETETKTLEQQAADQGKVLLDATQVADLTRKADAGEQAAQQLHNERFETAFKEAVRTGRAVPAEADAQKDLYALNADLTIKALEARPQAINVTLGRTLMEAESGEDAPHGIHPASFELDQQVRAKLTELGKGMESYVPVLNQMIADGKAAA